MRVVLPARRKKRTERRRWHAQRLLGVLESRESRPTVCSLDPVRAEGRRTALHRPDSLPDYIPGGYLSRMDRDMVSQVQRCPKGKKRGRLTLLPGRPGTPFRLSGRKSAEQDFQGPVKQKMVEQSEE